MPFFTNIQQMGQYFYGIGIFIYDLVMQFASLFNPKAKAIIRGRRDSFRLIRNGIVSGDRVIWVHAASLGEFEQGRPVMEAIRKDHPGFKILLTFYSPSGYEIRKNYEGADIICYLPADFRRNARKIIELAHPEMAVFIKYEFWPNYMKELHRKGIDTYSISAIFRPNQLFFHPWGKFYRELLQNLTHIFVQDDVSLQLLKKIQIEQVSVSGDTRFDRVASLLSQAKRFDSIEKFLGKAPVAVLGSTWPEDEQKVIPALLKTRYKVIVAPHEIDGKHLRSVQDLCGKGNSVLYSELNENSKSQFLIIDCIGILSSLYQYADFAYIGGGFGVGIHNILEAATYGKGVIFGPNYQNFKEARDLVELGAAIPVETLKDFEIALEKISKENTGEIAGKYTKENTGATQKILNKLFN